MRKQSVYALQDWQEIALAGSRRLRSTLAAAPILFARTVVTVAKTCSFITPVCVVLMAVFAILLADVASKHGLAGRRRHGFRIW